MDQPARRSDDAFMRGRGPFAHTPGVPVEPDADRHASCTSELPLPDREQVVAATGEDRTGQAFENVGFFKANPVVLEQYNCVARTGRPLHSLEPFTHRATGATYDVDRLLLPLSSDGRTVGMLMVLFHFKTCAAPAHSLGRPVRLPPRTK